MKIEKKIILEQSDFDYLHDVILEASDKSLSNEEIYEIWEKLPKDIKLQAEQWGIFDTIVKDTIYEFLKNENATYKNGTNQSKSEKNKIVPIRETGSSLTGTLTTSYKNIVHKVGAPNVTDMDDEDKVKASWGFKDEETGAEGFIWCYKYYGKPESCKSWSTDGDTSLLKELFGSDFETC